MEATQGVAQVGKGRLITFRVISVIAGLLTFLSAAFAVQGYMSAKDKIHIVHNDTQAWVLLAMIAVPMFVGLKSPVSAVAPFRVFVAACLAMIAAGIIGGDLLESGFLIMPVIAAVLLALHPARTRVWKCVKGSVAILLLGVIGLVPAFIFALHQGDMQRNVMPGMEEHAKFHHFTGMAFVALAMALGVMAAAFPGTKQRLAIWIAGVPAVLVGATDLAYNGYVGSLNPMWAWATIIWGVLVILVGEMTVRRAASSAAPTSEVSS